MLTKECFDSISFSQVDVRTIDAKIMLSAWEYLTPNVVFETGLGALHHTSRDRLVSHGGF